MHLCSLFCRIVAELMRKLAESRLMIDDNSKPFFTPKVSFALAVTFAIGILVFLQHQQADFERTPFQDGTYSLKSVSQENGQYSIDVILSEHSAVNAECALESFSFEPASYEEGGITYTSVQPGRQYEAHAETHCRITLSESEVQVQPADDGTKRVEKKSSILGTQYILHM